MPTGAVFLTEKEISYLITNFIGSMMTFAVNYEQFESAVNEAIDFADAHPEYLRKGWVLIEEIRKKEKV